MNRKSITILLILSSAIITGCSRQGISTHAANPVESVNLQTIRTLCLVELYNSTAYPQVSADVTDSLYQALQKKNISGLSLLRQNEAVWRNLPIASGSSYTLEQLLEMRKIIGVDAVLTGTVTSYAPYPHMSMGLQIKLVDLRDGQVVCSIDKMWDTADKATEQRIKK